MQHIISYMKAKVKLKYFRSCSFIHMATAHFAYTGNLKSVHSIVETVKVIIALIMINIIAFPCYVFC